MNGEQRKSSLLNVGVELAAKHGAENVSRRMIADKAKVSEPLVSRYLGSKSEIPKAIKKAAKKAGVALPDKQQTAELGEKLRKATRRQAAAKTMAKRAATGGNARSSGAIRMPTATGGAAKKLAAGSRNGKKSSVNSEPAKKPTAARKPKLPPVPVVTVP